jgi:phosphotriesterase-related protein
LAVKNRTRRISDARETSTLVLETVTGPVVGSKVRVALGHEHFFVDFSGPTSPAYMNVNWADVTGACVNNAAELRTLGVDLVIDWTNLGVGRNVLLLREISRRTGVKIVCATGIYKSLVPPGLAKCSVDELARHFYSELAEGIDGTSIRAGWVKAATTETGPTKAETSIHRAAARAATRAGAAIGLHSPDARAAHAVVDTLEQEGFDVSRLVWAHAQLSDTADHLAMATRGAMVQFDAIGTTEDTMFRGPTDDESMLDRIQAMVEAGFADSVLISADATVVANPAKSQYSRDNTYVVRAFAPKLRQRIGAAATRLLLRDNVIKAFHRGTSVG